MFPKPADYSFWFRLVIVVSLAFFAVNLIFFVGPFVALVTGVSENIGTKEIVADIGTLFATFIGAWLAFRFASAQRDRERIETEVAAGNRALFTLTVMYNETYQHQEEIIEQVRGRSDAWLNMPVTSPLSENLSFDIKDLSFLLQADPTIFQQVLLEEARFKLVASMITDHSSLNFTIIWPRMEAAGINRGDATPEKELKKLLGAGAVQRLQVASAGITKNIDENVKSLRAAFVSLRQSLKKLYPDRKFINFTFKPPDRQT